MSDSIQDAADALYTSYLARDFFAKVVPGSLVLATVVFTGDPPIVSPATLKAVPLFGWILIYAVCWAAGFAVQGIGQITRVFRVQPREEKDDGAASDTRRLDFLAMNPNSGVKAQHERYVVIKESTGNLAVAILIAAAFVGTAELFSATHRIWVASALLVPAVGALFHYHARHARLQRDYENLALKKLGSK